MNTKDFYYFLPPELIAQTPANPRSSSRMLVLHRKTETIEHKHFYDIIDYLNENDCLIINDSRVIPARLFGINKEKGSQVEFLLLKQIEKTTWETLVKPGKKAKAGTQFNFGDGILTGSIIEVLESGNRIIHFDCKENFFELLEKLGHIPLPPYITKKLEDSERYQTVYSCEPGSAAAPTAGLHFTNELLKRIEQKGVKIGRITLHVGLGTFRPVKAGRVEDHKMHSEHYSLSKETADIINSTRSSGGRVIAVGTTSCRTLESIMSACGQIIPCEGYTDIFIYPPFNFKITDALITNFHLPESSLMMLISSFADLDTIMKAYQAAIKEKYRFFSFGDAMFIV